jgi:uncharacterized protein (UPF0332 family)
MNPRAFLEVADTLIAGLSEAEWRSAVSRAYYGLFHIARRLLLRCGFAVPRADQAHTYLWRRLANAGHLDVVDAGNDANHLRSLRNSADYDIDRAMDQLSATGYLQLAGSISRLLEEVEADAVIRTRITETMKTYERDVLGQVTWHP